MEDESLKLCGLEKILTSESRDGGTDGVFKMFAKFRLKEIPSMHDVNRKTEKAHSTLREFPSRFFEA
jgi:hypothetical protein